MNKFKFKLKNIILLAISAFTAVSFCFGLLSFNLKNLRVKNEANSIVSLNYADVDGIIDKISESNIDVTSSSFDLSKIYPVIAENQDTSSLCTFYAGFKALETSYMKQTGEYKNYSEVGTALLAISGGYERMPNFNTAIEFEDFYRITQEFGVLYENDFPNDLFENVLGDLTNAGEDFDYLLKNKVELNPSNVLPVMFSRSNNFNGMTSREKQILIKKYIKTYGGVFAGLEPGTYIPSNSGYGKYVVGNKTSTNVGGRFITENHAVCLIGYSRDNNCFIAVNSWGVSNSSLEKFYISFDGDDVAERRFFNSLVGFKCYGNEDIVLTESSANKSMVNGGNVLKNTFLLNDEINLEFSVSNLVNCDNIYLSIYKGQTDVTGRFNKNFKSENSKFLISNSGAEAGDYLIKFYDRNSNVIHIEELFVKSGLEVAEFKFYGEGSSKTDTTLSQSYLTNKNTATFYAEPDYLVYNLQILLNDLTDNDISVNVSDCSLEFTNGGTTTKESFDSNLIECSLSSSEILLTIDLSNTDNLGKLLRFKLVLSGEDKTNEFYISVILGNPKSSVSENYTNYILYALNGGQNSELNLTRIPNYANENEMTEIELFDAVRSGFEFKGWYTDVELSERFDGNLNDIAGNLILYAKWDYKEISFLGDIEIAEIVDYDGSIKNTDIITYGDSVKISYNFIQPDELEMLDYDIKYTYFFNDLAVLEKYVDSKGSQDLSLDINFPKLTSGDVNVKIVVEVTIDRSFKVTIQKSLEFNVSKKQITINFANSESEYDGANHYPLNPIYSGVFAEDLSSFAYYFDEDVEAKIVGEYIFNVSLPDDSNYLLTGKSSFKYNITTCKLKANWKNTNVVYSGSSKSPDVVLTKMSDGSTLNEIVYVYLQMQINGKYQETGVFPVDSGNYNVKIASLSSSNFEVVSGNESTFTISRKKLYLNIDNIRDRLQTGNFYRKNITYKLTEENGRNFDESKINLSVFSDGLSANVSGNYPIHFSYDNKNYEVIANSASYVLVGTYKVFYTLPNGEIYEEIVEDNQNPKGITNDIYKKPAMSTFSYNLPLEYTGKDLYITVSINSYAWIVGVGSAVILLLVIYLFVTRKSWWRKNKVR